MDQPRNVEDPEPAPHGPAGLLLVPVRPGPLGCAARIFRTPLGDRTAVAFSCERRLRAALGPDQRWITLAEPAVRALAAPLGITALVVDPQLVAQPVGPLAELSATELRPLQHQR
ncbi:SAV_915 family protein [Kitasatospora sp. NPDC094015]|uniref:SAV_915 family protein n=1 Tax=Kitasatospora sp. NPDC094015 TaxID=3155205 RepID=UPI0033243BFC